MGAPALKQGFESILDLLRGASCLIKQFLRGSWPVLKKLWSFALIEATFTNSWSPSPKEAILLEPTP